MFHSRSCSVASLSLRFAWLCLRGRSPLCSVRFGWAALLLVLPGSRVRAFRAFRRADLAELAVAS